MASEVSSTALPVVAHTAPPPAATPAIPASRKVVVSTARRGPCCASPPAVWAAHPVFAAARTADIAIAQAAPLLR